MIRLGKSSGLTNVADEIKNLQMNTVLTLDLFTPKMKNLRGLCLCIVKGWYTCNSNNSFWKKLSGVFVLYSIKLVPAELLTVGYNVTTNCQIDQYFSKICT